MSQWGTAFDNPDLCKICSMYPCIFQNVLVEKSFVERLKEINEHRRLVVRHGGILSDYVIIGPPPKKKSSSENQDGQTELQE